MLRVVVFRAGICRFGAQHRGGGYYGRSNPVKCPRPLEKLLSNPGNRQPAHFFRPTERGFTPDKAIGRPPTTKRAASSCCRSPARANVAAGAAQFGLGDKGNPGLDLGVDQRAHLALSSIAHGIVVGHEVLMAGFDSGWSKTRSPFCTAMPDANAFLRIK
jgi:hypothetical protein